MAFRFYSNTLSHASRGIAVAVFMLGLMLAGIGVVIITFPQFFAYLAAAFFFIAGAGCAVTALKMYIASRRFMKTSQYENESGFNPHGNRIHELEDFDDDKSEH
jgi:hypothetical protein